MKWISVEDRLPEDDETVLMCEQGQDGIPMIGWYYCLDDIPGFYPANSFQNFRIHVTHWMPLPSPPEKIDTLVINRNVKDEELPRICKHENSSVCHTYDDDGKPKDFFRQCHRCNYREYLPD